MWNDLRNALRTLLRTPGFFALGALTLGLSIAANSAIFSLFHQVLLRTLPVPEPHQLVVLHTEGAELPGGASSDNYETVFSYPMYAGLRDRARSFDGLAVRSGMSVQISVDGSVERERAEVVSGNYFQTLGVRPAAGRLFTQDDDRTRGGHPVVVLSHDYWVRRFGASTAVLNRKISLNNQPFVVVGVAAPDFRGVLSGDKQVLFVPMAMRAALQPGWNHFDRATMRWLTILGRVKHELSREQAQVELAPIHAALLRDHMEEAKVSSASARQRIAGQRLELRPAAQGLNAMERSWGKPLIALFAMAGLLLLAGCANIANLLIARATGRARELAVRVALGASRWSIVRLLLAESLVLAAAGSAAGLLLAPLMARSVLGLAPADEFNGWLSAELNTTQLLFAVLLMFLTTVLFGLMPALGAARGGVRGLAERTQSNSLRTPVRKALVAAQIAISLALLFASGLFSRSLSQIMSSRLGFRAEQLISFSIDAGSNGYDTERGVQFYREVNRRLTALAGAQSAAICEYGPLSNSVSTSNVSIQGYQAREDENMNAEHNAVGPGYFRTLGSVILTGREFEERDSGEAPKVAVVNQAFARRFFSGAAPVGKRMSVGAGGPLEIEIVGLVEDSKNQSLSETVQPAFFVPYEQAIGKPGPRVRRATFFVRHAAGQEESILQSLRATVGGMDANIPVFAVRRMAVRVDETVFLERLTMVLSIAFGVLAALLTAVGLYGVIAYVVARRRMEIGIRMALGAGRGNVLALILREVAVMTLAGVAAGAVAALVAGRLLESRLFGVTAHDPISLTLAVLLVAVVSAGAGLIPSIAASRLHPLEALRYE